MSGRGDLYAESDFVKVVDEAGNVQPDAVPGKWVGTDLLPQGWKKATTRAAKADTGSGDTVPAVSSTRDVLEGYATTKAGLTDEEAKAFPTKEDLHAELVKRAAATS